MKIFVGILDFGAIWYFTVQKLREQGFDVIYVGARSHPSYDYLYAPQDTIWLVRLIEWCSYARCRLVGRSGFRLPAKVFVISLYYFFCFILFAYCLFTVDRYIYISCQSMLPLELDWRILNFFNKPILSFISHGRSRPPYLDGRKIPVDITHISHNSLSKIFKETKKEKKKVDKVFRYSDIVVGNPYHSQFYTDSFVSVFSTLACFTSNAIKYNNIKKYKNKDTVKNPLTIFHVPSVPAAKGSKDISRVLTELIDSGYDIKFKTFTSLPHSKVIEKLCEADLVIDQLYADVPLAALATECIILGIPVIVGGYEMVSTSYVDVNDYPHIMIHPDELKSTLIKIIENPDILKNIKSKTMEFAKRDFLLEFSRKLMALFEHDFTASAVVDPSQVLLFKGMGVSELRLHGFLKAYYNAFGDEGFFLHDKPELMDKIREFIMTDN